MNFQIDSKTKIVCPMCKRVAIKLVPLYEDDHKKVRQQCCFDCKRKLKKGQEIVKFIRDDQILKSIETEYERRAGKRQRVDVL